MRSDDRDRRDGGAPVAGSTLPPGTDIEAASAVNNQLVLDLDARVPDGAYSGVDVADENTEPSWRSWAWVELEWLAATRRPFTADDLRRRGVDEPDSPARWGALFVAARKAGLIEPTGTVLPSTTVSRRGSLVREWIGAPQAVQGDGGAS